MMQSNSNTNPNSNVQVSELLSGQNDDGYFSNNWASNFKRQISVLIVEPNNFHGELFPGIVKYFLDFHYYVDVLAVSSEMDSLNGLCSNRVRKFIIKNETEIPSFLEKYSSSYSVIYINSDRFVYHDYTSGYYAYTNVFPYLQKSLKSYTGKVIQMIHHKESVSRDFYPKNWYLTSLVDRHNSKVSIINTHYFCKVHRTQKNEIVKFLCVGIIDSKRKNFDTIIPAVRELIKKNYNFRIILCGHNNDTFTVPEDLKDYIELKGYLPYKDMFELVKSSDFFLTLLDPDSPEHQRYLSDASGSYQLSNGFQIPCLMPYSFLGHVLNFNEENSIGYSAISDLVVAMEKAILMPSRNYKKLVKNLKKSARGLYKKSLSNLNNILSDDGKMNNVKAEDFYKDYSQWLYDLKTNKTLFNKIQTTSYDSNKNTVKIFAHYLPQFYAIPQNDASFGKGFTEWKNVASAIPAYVGHEQPKIPYDLGFYTLDKLSVMERQVELAKMYGIYGFCFYWYWFSGNKPLAEPLNLFLNSNIDFKFHLCWCNEDWTYQWDNEQTSDVILKQELKENDAEKFFRDLLPFIKDSRYERIDNRPILMIYKPSYFGKEEIKKFLSTLNILAQKEGFDGFYFIGTAAAFYNQDPRDYGCQALTEFSSNYPKPEVCLWSDEATVLVHKEKISPNFNFQIRDMESFINMRKYLYNVDYPLFKCCFPSWDNTPRKLLKQKGYSFLMNGALFKKWLKDLIIWTKKNHSIKEQYLYVFSWNEWSEGAMLEPTVRHGYENLQLVREALQETEQ